MSDENTETPSNETTTPPIVIHKPAVATTNPLDPAARNLEQVKELLKKYNDLYSSSQRVLAPSTVAEGMKCLTRATRILITHYTPAIAEAFLETHKANADGSMREIRALQGLNTVADGVLAQQTAIVYRAFRSIVTGRGSQVSTQMLENLIGNSELVSYLSTNAPK